MTSTPQIIHSTWLTHASRTRPQESTALLIYCRVPHIYTSLGSRPDIAYAVSVISRYAHNPTRKHCGTVERIFQYLKGTVHLRLTFQGTLSSLIGYTDSTRRSSSGSVFNVGSGAISWTSKRQATVALPTCEAEYIA